MRVAAGPHDCLQTIHWTCDEAIELDLCEGNKACLRGRNRPGETVNDMLAPATSDVPRRM